MRSTYARYAGSIILRNTRLLLNALFVGGRMIVYKGDILIGKGAPMICH